MIGGTFQNQQGDCWSGLRKNRMKGKPGSQEYSHHHIMCSVWLENCLQCQQLWSCPAEFLEFNAAASVVTGHWLFLLPPQCSRAFVNYHLVQKCCLGQTKSGSTAIPSSGWVTRLHLGCWGLMRTQIRRFYLQKTFPDLTKCQAAQPLEDHFKPNQPESKQHLSHCLLLISIPASAVTNLWPQRSFKQLNFFPK